MRKFNSYLPSIKALTMLIASFFFFSISTVFGQATGVTVSPFSLGSDTTCPGGAITIKIDITGNPGLPISIEYKESASGALLTQNMASLTGNQITISGVSASDVFEVVRVIGANGNYVPTLSDDNKEDYVVNPLPSGAIAPIATDRVIFNESAVNLVFTASSGTGPFDINYTFNDGTTTVSRTQNGVVSGTPFLVNGPFSFGASNTFSVTTITDANCSNTGITGITTSVYKQNPNAINTVNIVSPTPYCSGSTLQASVNTPLPSNEEYTITYHLDLAGVSSANFTAVLNNTSGSVFTLPQIATNFSGNYSVVITEVSSKTLSPVAENASTGIIAITSPQIVINPTPLVNITFLNSTILSGQEYYCKAATVVADQHDIQFDVSNSLAGPYSYAWTYSNSNGVIPVSVIGQATPYVDAARQFALGSNTVSSLVVTDANGCSNTPVQKTIVVRPRPSAVLLIDVATYCEGSLSAFKLNLAASAGSQPYTFNYSVNGGLPIQATSLSNTTNTVTIPGSNTFLPAVYSISPISITDASNCIADDPSDFNVTNISFTVKPTPVATINVTPNAICVAGGDASNPTTVVVSISSSNLDAPFNYIFSDNIGNSYNVNSDNTGNYTSPAITLPANSGIVTYSLNSISDNASPQCVNNAPNVSASVTQSALPVLINIAETNRINCESSATRSSYEFTFDLPNTNYTISYNLRSGPAGSPVVPMTLALTTDANNKAIANFIDLVPAGIAGVRYRIEFTKVLSGVCANNIAAADKIFTPYIIPTPVFNNFSLDANAICSGNGTKLNFDVSTTNTTRLFYTVNGVADTLLFTSNSIAGNSQTVQSELVNPTTNASYEFTRLRSSTGGVNCEFILNPVEIELLNVNQTPTIAFVPDPANRPLTLCEGSGSFELQYQVTGTGGPYDVVISDGTSQFTQSTAPNGLVTFNIPVVSSKTYTVVSVTDNNVSPACINSNPGVSTSTTVRPQPKATILANTPTSFCAGQQAFILADIVGVGNVKVTINNGTSDEIITTSAGLARQLPVSLMDGSTLNFTITKVEDDQTNPTCVNNIPSAAVTIAKKIQPTVMLSTTTSSICNGGVAELVVNLVGSGVPLNYTIVDQDNNIVLSTTNLSSTPIGSSYTFQTPALTSSKVYSIVPNSVTDNTGCSGIVLAPILVPVTVKDAITASITSLSPDICSGSTGRVRFDITGLSGPYNVVYNVGAAPTNLTTTLNDGDVLDLTNLTVDTRITLISVAYANGSPCTVNTPNSFADINVIPSPSARIQSANFSACQDNPGNVALIVTGEGTITARLRNAAATFTTFATGTAGTIQASLAGIPQGNQVLNLFEVTAVVNGVTCVGNILSPSSLTVTVNPLPNVASIQSGNTSICAGDAVSFTATPTGTGPFRLYYNISGGAEQFVTLNNAAVSNAFNIPSISSSSVINFVRIEDRGQTTLCARSLAVSIPVSVNPAPSVVVTTSAANICQGQELSLNLDFTGVAPFEFDIQYLLNGVLISENYTNITSDTILRISPDASTNFEITKLLDANQGCTSSPGIVASVSVVPNPDVVFNTVLSACQNTNVTLSGTITSALGNNFTLIFSDGVTTFPLTVTGTSPISFSTTRSLSQTTTYTLVSVQNNTSTPTCVFTKNIIRTITAIPTPTATIQALPDEVCSDDVASTRLRFSLGGSGVISANWSARLVGSPTVIDNGVAAGPSGVLVLTPNTGVITNDIEYFITSITDDNTCVNTNINGLRDTVKLSAQPIATITGSGTLCEGENIVLNVNLTGKGSITLKIFDNNGNSYDSTYASAGVRQFVIPAPLVSNPTAAETISFTSFIVNSSTNLTTCTNSGNLVGVNFTVKPTPLVRIGATKTLIAQGATADLTFVIERGVGPFDVTLFDGTVSRVITVNSDGTTPDNVTVNPSTTTTYTITSVKDNLNNCISTLPTSVTITVVNAEVVLSGNGTVCKGGSIALSFSTKTTGNYSVVLRDNAGNVYPPITVPDPTTGYNIDVTPLSIGNILFTIQSAQLGATPVSFDGSATVTVLDKRSVNIIPQNPTICEGASSTARFEIVGNGTFTINYTITNAVLGAQAFSFTATQANSPVVRNIPAGLLRVGTNDIKITSVSNSIPGDNLLCPIVITTDTDLITVRPTPTASITFNPSPICLGSSVGVTFNSPVAPANTINVDYVVNNNGLLTPRSETGIANGFVQNFVPNGNFAITVTNVQYSNLPTCANGTRATYNLTVNPAVSATLSPNATICQGQSTALSVNFSGQLPVNFKLDDGVTQTAYTATVNPFTLAVSPNATTTYSLVDITDNNSCTGAATNTSQITVVTKPTVNLDFDPGISSLPICEGQQLTLRFDVAGGTAPYTILYTDGNGTNTSYIANATGFNNLVLSPNKNSVYSVLSITESANSCAGTAITGTPTVTVNKIPKIIITPSLLETCEGVPLNVRANITASNRVNFTIQNLDASDVKTFTNISPGIFDFVLNPVVGNNQYFVTTIADNVPGGCSAANVGPYNILVNQTPRANLTTTTEICQGTGTIDLSLNITAGSGDITVNYANDRGFTDSFLANGPGLYSLTPDPLDQTGDIKYFLTSISAVSASGTICNNNGPFADTAIAIVNPTPVVNIFSTTPVICQGQSATLIFKGEGNGPIEVDYNVDGITTTLILSTDSDADGLLDNSILINPTSSKTYRILQVRDNSNPTCINVNPNVAYTIKVNQNPEASLSGGGTICNGDATSLVFNLRGKAPITVTYSFNDNIGNTVTETFVGVPGLNVRNIAPSPSGIYVYQIDNVADGNSPTCSVNSASPNVTGRAEVRVNPLPLATLATTNPQICEGGSSGLEFTVTNFGITPISPENPFIITYLANSTSVTDTIIVDASGKFVKTVTPTEPTTYRLLSIQDNSVTKCFSNLNGLPNTTTIINVSKLPSISIDLASRNVCEGTNNVALNFKALAGNAPLSLNQYRINGGAPIPLGLSIPAGSAGVGQQFTLPATVSNADSTYFEIYPGDLRGSTPPLAACLNLDTFRIGVLVNPTPTGGFVAATPLTSAVCEGDSVNLTFGVTGRGVVRVNFTITETNPISGASNSRVDFVEGMAANSPFNYKLIITNNTVININSVQSVNGSTTCLGTRTGPANININVNLKPTVAISIPTNPVCEGAPVSIALTFGNGTAPFDAEIQYKNLLTGNVTSSFLTGLPGTTSLAPQAFTDTTLVSIVYVRDNASPTQCINLDTTSLQINVNKVETARITGDSTFCIGAQAGFNVALTGVGNITFVYKDNAGVTYPAITKTAGTYFIPVTQAPSTRIYTLVSVNDQSVPNCPGKVSGSARLVVKPSPQGVISGENTICQGESTTINLQLIGGLPTDTLTAYFKDEEGNLFTYSNRPGTYGVELSPTDSSVYTLDSIAYSRFGCASINVTGEAKIHVRPLPSVTLSAPSDVCESQSATVRLNLAAGGPFDVTYQIGTAIPVNESNVGEVLDVTFQPGQPTTDFKVLNITYRDLPQCVSSSPTGLATVTIAVRDTLKVVITSVDPNSTATGYRVKFTLTGGKPGTYLLNGLPVNATDSSAVVPNGENTFVFSDGSGCPDTTIVINFTAPCVSFAGTMLNTTTLQAFCEDDSIRVFHNGNHVLDANDRLAFVLHTNPGQTLGTVLARSNTPTFSIKNIGFPPLVYGQTYYVSAVVADSVIGGGFILSDRCISVSEGSPVVINKLSTVSTSLVKNAKDSICAGSPLQIRFSFQGTGPFTLNYQVLNSSLVAIESNTLASTPALVSVVSTTVPVLTNGFIVVSAFDDLGTNTGCERYLPNDTIPFSLSPLPDASFNVSDNTVCLGTNVSFTPVVINATSSYRWNFGDGNQSNLTSPTKSYDQGGIYNVSLEVTNEFGCISTSPVRQIQVEAPKNATIDITSTPNQAPFCAPSAITFTCNATPAFTPGDKLEWYVNGVQKTSAPLTSYTETFNDRGDYRVEVVYETAFGCRDTVFRVIRLEKPDANFDVLLPTALCVNEDYTLTLRDQTELTSWFWRFTGATSNIEIPNLNTTIVRFGENFIPPGTSSIGAELFMTSPNGCKATKSTSFTVSRIETQFTVNNLAQSIAQCFGDTNIFSASASPANGDVATWSWNYGDQTTSNVQMVDPKVFAEPGIYGVKLSVVSNIGCKDDSTLFITVNALPDVQANTDTVCVGQLPVVLATGANTYSWTGTGVTTANAANPNIVLVAPISDGDTFTYVVTGTSINPGGIECSNKDTITVSYFDLVDPANAQIYPTFQRTPIDTSFVVGYDLELYNVLPSGDTIQLYTFDLGDEQNRFIYKWSAISIDDLSCVDCPNPVFSPNQDAGYQLAITDIYGCFSASGEVNITLEFKTSIDLPDAFTPNGDGINDVIFPDGHDLDEVDEFNVYNRFGELIHTGSGNKMTAGWDGTYKGKLQASDSYTYTVIVKSSGRTGSKELKKSGTFKLIR